MKTWQRERDCPLSRRYGTRRCHGRGQAAGFSNLASSIRLAQIYTRVYSISWIVGSQPPRRSTVEGIWVDHVTPPWIRTRRRMNRCWFQAVLYHFFYRSPSGVSRKRCHQHSNSDGARGLTSVVGRTAASPREFEAQATAEAARLDANLPPEMLEGSVHARLSLAGRPGCAKHVYVHGIHDRTADTCPQRRGRRWRYIRRRDKPASLRRFARRSQHPPPESAVDRGRSAASVLAVTAAVLHLTLLVPEGDQMLPPSQC